MYFWGELVVHHRVNTRKFYDFAHKHLPAELLDMPEPNPTDEQFHDWYVMRRIGGFGLIWNRSAEVWLGMTDMKAPNRTAAIKRLVARGELHEVHVDGVTRPCYLRDQDVPLLEETLAQATIRPRAAILAPLDNLLWDRSFVEQLFGFRYRWEVYTPAAKREFGYYVLPVLYGDRFVARFEPVLDKKTRVLTVKNWWWEDGVRVSQAMQAELGRCVQRFMRFLGATELHVGHAATDTAHIGWLLEMGEVEADL